MLLLITFVISSAFSVQVHNGTSTLFMDIRLLVKMEDEALYSYYHRLLTDTTISLKIVFTLVAINYTSGTLFNTRREGSDIFWRSLPIKPWLDILAKLVTILIAVPLIYLACTFLIQLSCILIVSYISLGHDISLMEYVWQPAGLLQAWARSLAYLAIDILWLAPVFCWLLLCSAYSNRAPLLFSWIPLILIVFAEKTLFDSWNVISQTIKHSAPQEMILWIEGLKTQFFTEALVKIVTGEDPIDTTSVAYIAEALTHSDLGLGATAAVCIFLHTVRIHRYPGTQ